MTVGNHLRQNIPERLHALQEQYKEVELVLTEHLGVDPLLVQIIEQRLAKQGLQLSS